MKSINVSKKYPVTLTFLLDEEVTPQLFAEKVARALGGGTLRPGEAIRVPRTDTVCVVTDETLSLPAFGYGWYRPSKQTKRVTGNDRSKRGGNIALTPTKGRRAKRNAAAFAK